MKILDKLKLESKDITAIKELRDKLNKEFNIVSVVLFGSAAKGQNDLESDIDILIVTKNELNRNKRHEITDMAFDINLKNQTNISTLVVNQAAWEKGPLSVLPIHNEIVNEGIIL